MLLCYVIPFFILRLNGVAVAPYAALAFGMYLAIVFTVTYILYAPYRAELREYRRELGEYPKQLREHTSAQEADRTKIREEHRRWEREKARVERANVRWANDLYYCHRDDLVFLPGSSAVPPEKMREILVF